MEPLVSVIMANYNTESKYLEEAIQSILNQTYTKLELIIIDDASEVPQDDLINRLNDGRIIYLRNEKNQGLAVSLNRALEQAKGEYILRMDTDDIAKKERVEKQVYYMQKNPQCDIAGTRTYNEFEDGTIKKGSAFYGGEEDIAVELLFDCVLFHPSVIIRNQFLKKNNLQYNPERRRTQDYDLWVRSSLKNGKIHVMEEPLLIKREHANQASQKARKTQLKVAHELHEMLLNRLCKSEKMSEKDYEIHEYLCYPLDYDYDANIAKQMVKWVDFLQACNKKNGIYNAKKLKFSLVKHMYFALFVQYRRRNLKLKDLINKQVISPINVYVLFYTVLKKKIRLLNFKEYNGA